MIRENIVGLARSYIGCGVTNDRSRYAHLVMGSGDHDERYFTAPSTSGCALTVRGIWRESGFKHPLLDNTYHIGHAIADIAAIGREYHAWVPGFARNGYLPHEGDAVIVGASGHEHAYTILQVELEEGCLCEIWSVDGGQRDAVGNQCIGARHRCWIDGTDGIIDRVMGDPKDLGTGVRRPLLGWVDISQLPDS